MSSAQALFTRPDGEPLRVLVVCTGNICRSPAAALLLEQLQIFGSTARIESAGLGAVVGAGVDPPMVLALAGIESLDPSAHRAQQITEQHIVEADLVLTMSTKQRAKVLSKSPQAMGRVFTLVELGHLVRLFGRNLPLSELHLLRSQLPASLSLDIADPYRRGDGAMKIAALEIIRAISMLAAKPLPAEILAVAGGPPLHVMTSARPVDDRTSAYMVALWNVMSQEPGITYVPFSWRTALFGRVDVFHSHWPEAKLESPSLLKRWGRRAAFWLMTTNFKRQKTAVVQTLHNLAPHEQQPVINQKLITRFHQRETLRISINATTPHDGFTPIETILHGHSRSSFGNAIRHEAEPGTLAFFGLIREYKGVPGLLRAFAAVSEPLRLSVAGNPSPPSLASEISQLAAADDRVTLSLGHIPDADLCELITAASLVVLPYREMHNSGAAITALSMNRPVLVPRNSATDTFAAEVGEDWVIRYDGELSGHILSEAAARATQTLATGQPDLSRREWDLAGRQHLAAFAEAHVRAQLGLFRRRNSA